MKNVKFLSFIGLALLLVLFLTSTVLSLPGDPVPGIDVSLEQIPGRLVTNVTTNKYGRFTFDNLKPGNYLLKLVPSPLKAKNYNSSRSNVSRSVSRGDSTKCYVSMSLIKSEKNKLFEPIKITIGGKGDQSVV
jgi:hypothetical protein